MKNQTFGIEIEMNHITRAKAAQVIATHFGTSVRHTGGTYDTRCIPDGQGREWKIVSDSSIDGPANERTELVSPICRWEDIETVQELVRALRRAGAKAHSSCGIHVHIGKGSHTAKTLRTLVNIVNAKEDLLTMALQISDSRRQRWCKPVQPDFLERLNRAKPRQMDSFARLWYNTSDWQRCAHEHYNHTRYSLLNLHSTFQKGTIEFRAFGSTLHAGEVKTFIQLSMAISHQALTANSASPKPTQTDNPKYTFRCWLLRLGFIGDEFETARLHLLKHLPGNAAWRQAS
ncbi:amidoligase family protein [Eubacteriales bacterium OttesenSCG-928-A19]|nr:amidoligase family protein [Eubacteriales bacterium OttesenSCG-928-A19]